MASLELYPRRELVQIIGIIDLTTEPKVLLRELRFVAYLSLFYGTRLEDVKLGRPSGTGVDKASFDIPYGSPDIYEKAARTLRELFDDGVLADDADRRVNGWLKDKRRVEVLLERMRALPPSP